jgi:hypothetical protein
MRKEHVENAKLNHSLVCARTQTVQYHSAKPLPRSTEFSKPNTSTETEDCRDEEHWAATNFHGKGDPEDIDEPLMNRSVYLSPMISKLNDSQEVSN